MKWEIIDQLNELRDNRYLHQLLNGMDWEKFSAWHAKHMKVFGYTPRAVAYLIVWSSYHHKSER